MKRLWILFGLAVPLMAAWPQETAPEGFLHWDAASFAPMVRELKTKAASDAHYSATQRPGEASPASTKKSG
jgi:hypothetical protein